MPIKFYCKKCGQRLSISSKKSGKAVACPACKSRITIPFKSEEKHSDPPAEPPATQKPPAPPRRKPSEPAPAPVADAPLDEEQDQFLSDLDELGPIGESWDELLAGDWEQETEPESFREPEPSVANKPTAPDPPAEQEAPLPEMPPEEIVAAEEAEVAAAPESEPVAEQLPAVPPAEVEPERTQETDLEPLASELDPASEEPPASPAVTAQTRPAAKKYVPTEERWFRHPLCRYRI